MTISSRSVVTKISKRLTSAFFFTFIYSHISKYRSKFYSSEIPPHIDMWRGSPVFVEKMAKIGYSSLSVPYRFKPYKEEVLWNASLPFTPRSLPKKPWIFSGGWNPWYHSEQFPIRGFIPFPNLSMRLCLSAAARSRDGRMSMINFREKSKPLFTNFPK